jgi:hypothetical protein
MTDRNTLKNQVVAMSNTLAKKSTRFSVTQQKLFYVSIASLRNGLNERDEVAINKQELFNFLGIENETGRYTRIKKELDKLRDNSKIEFNSEDGFESGSIIRRVRLSKNTFYIMFDSDYLPLVYELKDKFVRFLNDDLIGLKSKYSMMLYQNLMKDKWKMSNIDFMGIDYSTKQLKDMFGLPKEAYMATNGNFNRADFERYTINKAIKELNEKCKCIKNLKYEKVKKNGRVQYYKFSFDYTDPKKFSSGKRFMVADNKKEESNELNGLHNELGRLLESL